MDIPADPRSQPQCRRPQRTETYGYDPQLDYLTSASYNDGLPNANPQWSYDAAGNRTDLNSSFNNLNMATAIQGTSCTNRSEAEIPSRSRRSRACRERVSTANRDDVLGNRTGLGTTIGYGWDALNRMTTYTAVSEAIRYGYRADGMRVSKLNASAAGSPVTRYRYDGQMGRASLGPPPRSLRSRTSSSRFAPRGGDATWTGNGVGGGSWSSVTRYGLGARGIDYLESSQNGGAFNSGFPVYDAHGNMVATLARSGNNSYSLGNQRSFDAWGMVRLGAQSGDPSGRYCGNLGHKQDDESGLIYMRARYYEPASGRFITEDPSLTGLNWFAYARNSPTNKADRNGRSDIDIFEEFKPGPALFDYLIGYNFLKHMYHIAYYGSTHPVVYGVGKGAVAVVGIALLTAAVLIVVTVCVLAAFAETAILAGIILVAFAMLLYACCETGCDMMEDDACNNSSIDERGGWR